MNLSFKTFSYILEERFNKVTGLKFETQYFLSVFFFLLSTTFAPKMKEFDA